MYIFYKAFKAALIAPEWRHKAMMNAHKNEDYKKCIKIKWFFKVVFKKMDSAVSSIITSLPHSQDKKLKAA